MHENAKYLSRAFIVKGKQKKGVDVVIRFAISVTLLHNPCVVFHKYRIASLPVDVVDAFICGEKAQKNRNLKTSILTFNNTPDVKKP